MQNDAASLGEFVAQVLGAMLMLAVIHVSALALAARAFGITIREVSYGWGRVLVNRGKVNVRILPLGGFVRMKDTRAEFNGIEPLSPQSDAYDQQPRIIQALVPLLGGCSLVLVAWLLMGRAAFAEVLAGFRHLFAGAMGPISSAPVYVQAARDLTVEHGFAALVGLLAAKLAALSLLPLPTTNAGQAMLALFFGSGKEPRWYQRLTPLAVLAVLALVCSWAIGFAVFVCRGIV